MSRPVDIGTIVKGTRLRVELTVAPEGSVIGGLIVREGTVEEIRTTGSTPCVSFAEDVLGHSVPLEVTTTYSQVVVTQAEYPHLTLVEATMDPKDLPSAEIRRGLFVRRNDLMGWVQVDDPQTLAGWVASDPDVESGQVEFTIHEVIRLGRYDGVNPPHSESEGSQR